MAGQRPKNPQLTLFLILLGALGLRLGVRLVRGEVSYWDQSYAVYHRLAANLIQGDDFCLVVDGLKCAYWPPTYPLFLALVMLVGESYVPIVVFQSLISVGTVLCVFLLGKELFGAGVGILASLLACLYPYYVWHDTSLQESSLLAFLTVLGMWLLYRAMRGNSIIAFGLAGFTLGLALLTKSTLVAFLILLFLGMVVFAEGVFSGRLRRTVIVFVSLAITVSPWLIRNHIVVGAPVLTSRSGRQLWIANNAYTFSHYPSGRIDHDEVDAWNTLTQVELAQVTSLSGDELAQQDWFMKRGLDFIAQNPVLTARRAIIKVTAAFMWKFSPAKGGLFQAIYFMSYSPILTLGVTGMWLSRRRWRDHLPIYFLLLGFVAVTAVFHAHTSHRAYLDIYLMIFAAHAIQVGLSKWGHPWGVPRAVSTELA